MDFQPLEYIYFPSGKPEAATLLLLHGTGGDERDLLPMSKYFGDTINVLSVRGNVLENGMPRFFKRLGMGIFDENDLEFRAEELAVFLEKIADEQNFDASKIIALGYSNGANIAGAVLNLYPDLLLGAILFRPMLPFQKKGFSESHRETPVLLTSGKHDPTVPESDTQKYVGLLNDAGFDVSHHHLDAGHNLTQQDLDLATDWFQSKMHDLVG